MTADLDIDRLRADTPGTAHVAHLNNAGSALPPAVVVDTMTEHLDREARVGGYEAVEAVSDRVRAVYESVALLVGGRADQVALVESATEGWSRALQSIAFTFPPTERDRVLVSSAEYASNVLPLLQVARRTGTRIEFIPDDEHGCVDVAALRGMLDDDVAIVAINHCPSQNGLVNDVVGVGEALRGSPAWYIVDACQSVGQLPVDVAAMRADFLSATGRKWLRGPRGTGFLHVSDRALEELEPFPLDLVSGTWLSDGYEVEASAARYEYFERSYAGVLGLGTAIDYALDLGINALAARIDLLATQARDLLSAVPGVTVLDRGPVRSGIVTLTSDIAEPTALQAALRAVGVNVSLSFPPTARHDFDRHGVTGVVRMSAHAYNTIEEIDLAVRTVAGAAT